MGIHVVHALLEAEEARGVVVAGQGHRHEVAALDGRDLEGVHLTVGKSFHGNLEVIWILKIRKEDIQEKALLLCRGCFGINRKNFFEEPHFFYAQCSLEKLKLLI